MDKNTKSFYKSQAAFWEAKFLEMKACAQRLAKASAEARAEAKRAKQEAEDEHRLLLALLAGA